MSCGWRWENDFEYKYLVKVNGIEMISFRKLTDQQSRIVPQSVTRIEGALIRRVNTFSSPKFAAAQN
jgi:hypothetical protein